nr:MAG TPA: hypothetical protein [Bacteriophage sp.]DAP98544.1 MAG TPA: helix-turn-helix domain protein [Caudoviricetes sp.]DAU48156.1 MAG TPA: helix-turn-helix domain protein [Bacteriophage sp.]
MSKSNVTAWKAGRNPTLDTVIAVADYLGVSPARFIKK